MLSIRRNNLICRLFFQCTCQYTVVLWENRKLSRRGRGRGGWEWDHNVVFYHFTPLLLHPHKQYVELPSRDQAVTTTYTLPSYIHIYPFLQYTVLYTDIPIPIYSYSPSFLYIPFPTVHSPIHIQSSSYSFLHIVLLLHCPKNSREQTPHKNRAQHG